MDWLKGIGKSTWIALLAFIAALAVAKSTRKEKAKRKWQEASAIEAQSNVDGNIDRANRAMEQAKVASVQAKQAKEQARKKLDAIGKTDPDIASIVSGWRSSRLRND